MSHAAPTLGRARPPAPSPRKSRALSVYCSMIISIYFDLIQNFETNAKFTYEINLIMLSSFAKFLLASKQIRAKRQAIYLKTTNIVFSSTDHVTVFKIKYSYALYSVAATDIAGVCGASRLFRFWHWAFAVSWETELNDCGDNAVACDGLQAATRDQSFTAAHLRAALYHCPITMRICV